MIKKLRKKFIIIATLSVALAMILLSVIVNAADFISTDRNSRRHADHDISKSRHDTHKPNRSSRRALQHGNALFHKIFCAPL